MFTQENRMEFTASAKARIDCRIRKLVNSAKQKQKWQTRKV